MCDLIIFVDHLYKIGHLNYKNTKVSLLALFRGIFNYLIIWTTNIKFIQMWLRSEKGFYFLAKFPI